MQSLETEMSNSDLRQFGLITAAMLLLFFFILIPWIWDLEWPVWPWIPAGILSTLAIIYPASLRPFYKVWMKFAGILGWINTRIILGLVFFLIFVPFGIIMRLFNDPLRRSMDKSATTYRIPSLPPKSENMEKPF